MTLVLVQGAISQGQKWDRAFMLQTFRHYLDLTREGVAQAQARYPGTKIVVLWPETASPFLLETDDRARAAVAEAAGAPADGAVVLAGSVRFDAEGRPRNSLIALDSGGPPLAIYDKWHLVPFGEYQPSWIPITVIPGGGFASGPGPRTMVLPGLPPVGPLICYEAIFPAEIVDEADRPGLARQRHERCLVRQFQRPAPAPRGGPDPRRGGGFAARPRGQYRHLRRVRRARA